MKRSRKVLAFLLVTIMLFSLVLVSCSEPAPDPVETEYTEPIPEGYRQLTLYFTYNGTYENCDVWAWWDGKDGKGYLFHECDYGAKAIINVPEEITEVGFIVRRDCSDPGGNTWGSATKDYENDRFAELEGKETKIYLQSGVEDQFYSDDGGKTLNMRKKLTFAGMVDVRKIQYRITPKAILEDFTSVKVLEGERELAVTGLSTLGRAAATGYIEVGEDLDLTKTYRVWIEGYGEKTLIPTKIFDSDHFAENFHYDGNDLGAHIHGNETIFKVWAPTASRVVLNLFKAGHDVDAYKSVDMTKGEKGIWTHTEACGHGTYYTYTVTTPVGTQEAVDPYAKAAGVNGDRGMVVDLSLTDPDGWEEAVLADPITDYSDAIIWEIHIRDFSGKIGSSAYQGKYLAFTETGLVNEHGEPIGIDYLKQLGITHVHILPMYDYATVDERDPEAGFNWGYDPKNYNVPEGSYATDPYHGEVRIREMKEMVMALHEAGIGVIMDMVYNHTYDANSSFNRIVPYYYYRYTNTGANTSASGCGNDTASERYMFGKFMKESTAYWVEEYQLDGLRFDLMGLHDLATMQAVESAVHTINPHAILYGEGWTMGATIDGSAQANQSNISKIIPTGDAIGGIAVFNDVIRDGLKGSVFEKTEGGYISGRSAATLSKILFGMRGGEGMGQGWSVENDMVINYMSAHDNHTLWDKLLLTCPEDSEETLVKRNRLGAAILMLSEGTPFFQAGEEMLRTKNGDENSYRSSDAINNIDWSALKKGTPAHDMMLYYKGLIELRGAFAIFREDAALTHAALGDGAAAITLTDENGGRALILVNPTKNSVPYTLEEEWNLIANGEQAGDAVLSKEQGTITMEGISILVYVDDLLLSEP